jgi:PAS domain S-box-containing protein
MNKKLTYDELEQRLKNLEADAREQKRTKEALLECREELRALLDSVRDGIVVLDMTGRVTRVNNKAIDVIGYSEGEIIGKRLEALTMFSRPSIVKMLAAFTRVIAGNEILPLEVEGNDKRGQTRYVEVHATVLRKRGVVAGVVAAMRDITERKRLEEERKRVEARLKYVEKIEAIGTLAGGIAHNFNNLLMAVLGNAAVALLDTDPTHPNYERLKNIEKVVGRGLELTSQLLGYARKGSYEARPLQLNDLVKETADKFGATNKKVRIHLSLTPDLGKILADQRQIEQVLWNVCVNAAEAMPDGGDLSMRTMNVTDRHLGEKPYEVKRGRYVLLTVSDTGAGMDKQTKQRIFEPFFTTKEVGKGTGLGLASAYGIVKAHDGYIDLESRKGQGTTFSIYLPTSGGTRSRSVTFDDQLMGDSEIILLVDDEEMILAVGAEMLNRLGYTVLEAKDGREAVEIYRAHQDRIDLVILDMVMPDMNGGEVYDKMKDINPDVKALLSSGYSINGLPIEMLEQGCDEFIQKPFGIKELAERIREILGRN